MPYSNVATHVANPIRKVTGKGFAPSDGNTATTAAARSKTMSQAKSRSTGIASTAPWSSCGQRSRL